jgi:hypothetical protein
LKQRKEKERITNKSKKDKKEKFFNLKIEGKVERRICDEEREESSIQLFFRRSVPVA